MSKTIPEFPAADTPLSSSDLILVWQDGLKRAELGDAAGLVVETGSNANGSWVRFVDGTQIAWHEVIATGFDVTTAAGDIFRSSDIEWTFPASVTTNRIVIPSVRRIGGSSLSIWAGVNNYPATNTANIRVYSATSQASLEYNLIGFMIGRWF